MRKANLYKILFLVFFWVVAAVFVVLYDSAILKVDVPQYGGEPIMVDIVGNLFIVVITTFVAGTAIAACEVFYLNRLLRKWSLGSALLLKTGFYVANICFFVLVALLSITARRIGESPFHHASFGILTDYLLSPRFVMTIVFWGLAVLIALFILQVSEKFGQGVLLSFLLGKYRRPKEETRIFMFMDLKSSTTYAEKLGHVRYSELIQDCFADLTETVVRHEAQIYQNVGDEVVLTWEMEKGLSNQNCLATFFDYDRALRQKESYYKTKYSVVPEFKAGVNLGEVMVAEVGQLKKELAYHGDALN
ncbi:MAG: adenylate/guanylate cyclase domain-containing protein, partial [Bacteroidota bacterium]